MKHFLLHSFKTAAICVMAAASALPATAQWEQIKALPVTYAHYITKEGNFLMSDFRPGMDGGIYISEDKGATWTKTDVADYNYNQFYEAGDYLFALGSTGCRLARSEDGGHTWQMLNYTKAVEDYLDPKALDYNGAYGIAELDGILYLGDFSGGGILRSEDYGESWEQTDRESYYIYLNEQTPKFFDAPYQLVTFKGKIYSFALYTVHSYDPDTDKWTQLDIWSNCMSVSAIVDGKLVCGRAIQNDDWNTPYLVYTEDGETWGELKRPNTMDNYVRAMHYDGEYLYTAHPEGYFYYTSDLGDHWNEGKNLSPNIWPMKISSDKDYVYASVYHFDLNDKESGLYRMAKSELTTGIESAERDLFTPGVADGRLSAGCTGASIKVFDASGKQVVGLSNVSSADISHLAPGIYIYRINASGKQVSGKFVK